MCSKVFYSSPFECVRGLEHNVVATEVLMRTRGKAARAEQKRGVEVNCSEACPCTRGMQCSPLSLCRGWRQFASSNCILGGVHYEAAHGSHGQDARREHSKTRPQAMQLQPAERL